MEKADSIVRLAIKSGFDEAVVSVTKSRRNYLKMANAKVDSIVEKYGMYASLFVTSKKKVFFTNIQKLDDKSIASALARAKKEIKNAKPKEDYYGIAEGPFKYGKGNSADKAIQNISNDHAVDIANAAISGAVENGATNAAGTLFTSYYENEIATSKNVHAKGSQTAIRLSLRAFRGDNFSFHDVVSSSGLNGIKAEKLGRETAEMTKSMERVGKIENGKYDIIYKQSPGGSLISMTNMMACIGNVETGGFFTNKLGKEVASKEITIYDDGNMKNAINSSPYDREGYPTQRTEVVKNGKFVNYLHNYSTAQKYKAKSTGNAGLVEPESNTLLFKHKKSLANIDALVKRVEKGILVTNTWYTRFSNYLTGDFSTVPRDLALYIEKGEIKFAIKQSNVGAIVGIRVSDSMIRMMKNTECAANDTIQATSWDVEGDYYFMPSILVRNVSVTTA